jgi:SAM-dependent methyltransferase
VRIRIFAVTLFLSAFLLFVCQPMVGKMLLPYLGGAAAVWTTCVLFFQAMLLFGYVYAHVLARMVDVRKQILVHSAVVLLPLAFLPITFHSVSSENVSMHPAIELLWLLIVSTAVPFFVVSTTAPLVQNWFSRTRHAASEDPYFLYSASNAGSLLALLVYPFVIEPRIGVAAQTKLWFAGYAALLAVLAYTAVTLSRTDATLIRTESTRTAGDLKTRFFWIAAAFVPSGLMLAVTNHIAANVGSVPFLWIVPLALYLLTFVVAFARRYHATSQRVSRIIPAVLLIAFPLVAAGVVAPPGLNWIVIAAHLTLFYCGALLCHTRLAESRPDPEQLTEFYFWIAFGGVLGGVFTATLAPVVFSTILEYPLLVAVLAFFRRSDERNSPLARDGAIALVFALAMVLTWIVFRLAHLDSDTEWLALAHTALFFVAYKLKNQTRRFAFVFAVLMLAYTAILPTYIEGADRIFVGRNFFGVKKVLDDRGAHLRKLLHGDTIHGIESTDPARAGQPLSYYYPGGSVSDVVEMLRSRGNVQRFGVLGLGAGTMAAYADANHHVRFYEIDPSVETIARQYFTFLPRCGTNCDVIIGDGRLRLAHEPDGTFDFLLLDAFSSDSVPTHLLSREALKMYVAKLAPGGVLVFNVSNRYLNVEKLVSALIADAGLVAFSRFDEAGDLRKLGKSSAQHVVAARSLDDVRGLTGRIGWKPTAPPPGFQPWTDDYSNLLSLIRWH